METFSKSEDREIVSVDSVLVDDKARIRDDGFGLY